jgi:hypothetical protein
VTCLLQRVALSLWYSTMFWASKSECYCLFSGNSQVTWSQMKMGGFSVDSGMRTNSTTGQTAWSPMKQNVNYISLNIFMMAVEQCSVCNVSISASPIASWTQHSHDDVSNHDLRVFIHCSEGMWRNVKTSSVFVIESYAVHLVCFSPCFPVKAITFCTVNQFNKR